MTTVVSSKGRIVLPAQFRRQDRIDPGQEFEIKRVGFGEYTLRRKTARNAGLLDCLLACPKKGFFVPIDSESTHTLG